MTYWKRVMQEDVLKHQLEKLVTFLIMQCTIKVNQEKFVLHLTVVMNLKRSQ